jgi:predicted MFS family arabinose efflux permease
MGPMVGALVYPYLRYRGTMYFFGLLNLATMLICYKLIPDRLNSSSQKIVESPLLSDRNRDLGKTQLSKIGWKLILTNRHSFFALTTCFVGIFNITFFQGFLTTELTKLDLEDSQAGFMISTISFFYLFGCILLPYTCAKSPRKFQFFMSFIGFTICMVLMGPSKFLKLPR